MVLMSVAGQYSGNGLGYFNSVIYENLGITSVNQQLAYNLLYAVISAIGALIGALLSDRMPRRKVLVFGTFGESHRSRPPRSELTLPSLCLLVGYQRRIAIRHGHARSECLPFGIQGCTCGLPPFQFQLHVHLHPSSSRRPDRGSRDHHSSQGSRSVEHDHRRHGLPEPGESDVHQGIVRC